jgi:uncharacterized protein YbjT (DUF2867 family)
MCGADRDLTAPASLRGLGVGVAVTPRRDDARITVALSEREVRAMIRATTLVADVLRPELMRQTGSAPDSPLVTAYQALIAACERHGIDLGLGSSVPRDPS